MQNVYTIPEQPESILDGADISLHVAGRGRRLANLLIDSFLFDTIVSIVFVLSIKNIIDSGRQPNPDDMMNLVVPFYGYSFLFFIAYNTLFEWLSQGKSPGKLLTGTRAVNEDGTRIGFKKAILRTLCRLIPFEMFSALGSPSHPWHDSLTKTRVINERRSVLPS